MKQNRQLVKVNSDFIPKELSAGAVKVLFLLASVAQASHNSTVIISNARIAERTGLTNITRLLNELTAYGAILDRLTRFKDNRQKCSAIVLSEKFSEPSDYALVPAAAAELPKSCLKLFILYCIHANAEGRCLLSLSMIHELSGLARGTIVSCNKELAEHGFIAKQQYIRREGDYGYNRVYISHLLRRRHGLRRSETFRVIVNSETLVYESKCTAEVSLDRPTSAFARVMRYLFRSTRVADFIRRIRRSAERAAAFLWQKRGSRKTNTRFIYLQPVLLI